MNENIAFAYSEVPTAVQERIVSCPEEAAIPLENLRYVRVLHYDFDGNIRAGELVVNASVAHEVVEIFFALYLAKYPIYSLRLIDDYGGDDSASMEANNSSAFNYRTVAGTKVLSAHGKGLAIDINPLFNPCVYGDGRVAPESGAKYANRNTSFPGKINSTDLAYQLFTDAGWTWGGNWQSLKDYQHFEKTD